MQRSNVSSCDLDRARELSMRLVSPKAHSAVTPPPSPYVRFARSGAAVPALPAVRADASTTFWLDQGPLELSTWDAFLAWAIELFRARAAFVVDPQGFVIARRGNVPSDGFEGTGAELCYAMGELHRVDPDAGALINLELRFEGRTLLAVRAHESEAGSYVVGFVGPRSPSAEATEALLRQLRHSFSKIA